MRVKFHRRYFAFVSSIKFNLAFSEATVKLSKFCSLRPAHVKLCNKDFDVTSMLQVDFAENVPCDSLDEDDSTPWSQAPPVSTAKLFKIKET